MSGPQSRKRPCPHHHQQHQSTAAPRLTSKMIPLKSLLLCLATVALVAGGFLAAEAKTTFEKMTNRDYSGISYYTIQNVSLFECLGWCKEEVSCTSAEFSFVVNPFAALQETTCMLQNETQARQTAYLRQTPMGDQLTVVAQPQKATNLYFFNKIELPTDSVCSRLWAFERFPNRRLRQKDRQPIFAPSKEACQAACMNEQRFVCRSVEYNYLTQQCQLNSFDRRSPSVIQLAAIASSNGLGSMAHATDLIESPGTDYFENACLLGEDICNESRFYDYAKIGLPPQRVAHFVELNYYPDKEMLVKSQAGCVRACTIEHEFICRSILYRSSFKQGQPNCALYHLDQRTFPDGAETFMTQVMQPLLDSGETSAIYLEAVCNDTIVPSISSQVASSTSTTLGTTITMPPSTLSFVHAGSSSSGGGGGPPSQIVIQGGLGGHHMNHSTSSSSSSHEERYQSSTSTLSPLATAASTMGLPATIRLPGTTFLPSTSSSVITPNGHILPANIQISDNSMSGPGRITIGPSRHNVGGVPSGIPPHIQIHPAPDGGLQFSTPGSANQDHNCDAHGYCYDVALRCTDSKMVVNVKTQRPFFGRIYALGRSETCNANVKNQNQFQLDMPLTGQECNTQSASGTYTNTIVLQHHNMVLTKADKVYHVRCTYETASRNVSFGMLPIKDLFEQDVNDRNQETISITANSDAPLPKISILTMEGKEASTVRIGDRLTFRIEIPDNTPYGIFARSCIAMAKDARSTFEIIDENGCPVDHTIFPNFLPVSNGNALESNYEAFRFTESYGVIFQCNVKYCIGKCEPVNCGIGRDSVEAWGRKKRSIGLDAVRETNGTAGKQLGDDMTLSREIVVLDLKEKDSDSSSDSSSSSSSQSKAQKLRANDPDTFQSPLDTGNKHCLSTQSLFVLICSIGLFFVLYVCVVAYFFARRSPKISPIKHQFH